METQCLLKHWMASLAKPLSAALARCVSFHTFSTINSQTF